MDGLTKRSKSEKDKYNNTYVQNLNYDTNDEFIYETETDSQTQRTDCGCQSGGKVGERWSKSLRLADTNYYI